MQAPRAADRDVPALHLGPALTPAPNPPLPARALTGGSEGSKGSKRSGGSSGGGNRGGGSGGGEDDGAFNELTKGDATLGGLEPVVASPMEPVCVQREVRPPWDARLAEAMSLRGGSRPRLRVMDLTQPDVAAVLCGTALAQPEPSRDVLLFLSSTFTDHHEERTRLHGDVFPYLRKLCRTLGLHFMPVDMRWGVRRGRGDGEGW